MTASPVVDPRAPLGSASPADRLTHPIGAAGLDTISLADLTDIAGLDSRVDRKYIVDPVQLQMLIDGLGDRLVALDIDGRTDFHYESSYFDTPELDAYLGSALNHVDRLKVRTRTYLDLASTKVEVKVQDATGITRKFRQDHPFEMRQTLTERQPAMRRLERWRRRHAGSFHRRGEVPVRVQPHGSVGMAARTGTGEGLQVRHRPRRPESPVALGEVDRRAGEVLPSRAVAGFGLVASSLFSVSRGANLVRWTRSISTHASTR